MIKKIVIRTSPFKGTNKDVWGVKFGIIELKEKIISMK